MRGIDGTTKAAQIARHHKDYYLFNEKCPLMILPSSNVMINQ